MANNNFNTPHEISETHVCTNTRVPGAQRRDTETKKQKDRERGGHFYNLLGPHLQLHELVAVVRDLVTRLAQLRGGGLGLTLPLGLLRLRLGQLGLRGRLVVWG